MCQIKLSIIFLFYKKSRTKKIVKAWIKIQIQINLFI